MKLLAISASAVAVLFFSGWLGAGASARSRQVSAAHMTLFLPSAQLNNLAPRRLNVPLAGGTPVVAPSATAAPTSATPTPPTLPTPTPTTGTSYPDAGTILQNMAQELDLLNGVHFEQIADQQGSETLHVSAKGDAICSGPSLRAHVVAAASVSGTSQHSKTTFDLIQIKNKFYYKATKTKHRWEPTKAKVVSPFGFSVQNPLSCPNASSSSGGGSSGGTQDQIKDLVNQGPDTVAGVSVWHIHAIDVQVDSAGNTSQTPLDWYVSQQHSLLYRFVVSFSDPANNVTGSLITNLTKFGEHVTIHAPKKGSAKP
ncbi:MAG: hypothetical protein ACR2GA_03360 [Chloroflexota bacterium]